MTRFLKNVILFVIAVVLIPLSVANRHTVSLSLNPLDPQDPRLTIPDIPLFWIIFASLGVGIIVGGLGAWAKQGRWRKEARVKRREAAKWHKEADQLREMNTAGQPASISRDWQDRATATPPDRPTLPCVLSPATRSMPAWKTGPFLKRCAGPIAPAQSPPRHPLAHRPAEPAARRAYRTAGLD